MNSYWKIVFGVLCGLLGAGIILLTLRQPAGESIQLRPLATPAPVTIYLVGSVQSPGVYILPAGSRIQDAVMAAGGLLPDANPNNINLAALLVDGERIVVLGQTETETMPSQTGNPVERSSSLDGLILININTASQSDLELLPGIGPVTAQKIIEYRAANGFFTSIEALLDVPGIGEKTLAKIKDLITVGD